MSQPGAEAALAGYRVQALYSLKRILKTNNQDIIFQPEGLEDLDVFENGRNVELVQIKRYESLQLSNLAPQNPNSFLRRAATALENSNPPRILLVNFGDIGPEIAGAWKGNDREQQLIRSKLEEHGYLSTAIDAIFKHIEIVSLNEAIEEEEVYQLLRTHELLTGIDPYSSFELLHAWLFGCMEKRQAVTLVDAAEKVLNVGRFLAERRDSHDQWFTTILPLETQPVVSEQRDRLQEEFFAGGFTRFEHILAGVDFRRSEKLLEIKRNFEEDNVVIIHAASGQGKTTLALRYVYDNFPSPCRFMVARIENIQHALSVANALNGHARAIQIPMVVYLDVHPRDTDWPALVGRLAQHPNLQLLVTVREEDYRRANVPGEGFSFSEISLYFDEAEAQLIYERAQAYTSYLDFESAWDAFGGSGPLMEFAHLLTQNTTLRQKLHGQVQRIRTEVSMGVLNLADYRLLCLVAVANAYETRVNTDKLLHYLDLPLPEQTFERFQREFLIRISQKGYIEALHPLRSRILVDLLVSPDIRPWQSLAEEVLPLILEEDLETFLLYAFSEQADSFIPIAVNYHPETWRGRAGVLRSLYWVGLRNYVETNRKVIDDARAVFGPGWFFIADLNFPDEDAPSISEWWKGDLATLFDKERLEQFDDIHARQTPKDSAFDLLREWFSQLSEPPSYPDEPTDWAGSVELLYWASRLEFDRIRSWIDETMLDTATTLLSLPALADLSYALYRFDQEHHLNWLNRHRTTLEARLAQEFGILYLEENDSEALLKTHFLVQEDTSSKDRKDPLHGRN